MEILQLCFCGTFTPPSSINTLNTHYFFLFALLAIQTIPFKSWEGPQTLEGLISFIYSKLYTSVRAYILKLY